MNFVKNNLVIMIENVLSKIFEILYETEVKIFKI